MSDAIAPIDSALLPTAVRNGDDQRKKEYQAALQFERVLVGQMTKAMAKGAFGDEDSSSEGGSDAATQQLKQTLPDTLADALMSNGGIGLAGQLDAMWHPEATSTSVSKQQAAASEAAGGDTTGDSGAATGGASA